jgi:hypothetical protein
VLGIGVYDLLYGGDAISEPARRINMGNEWRPSDRIPQRTEDLSEIRQEHEERVANLEAKQAERFQQEVQEGEQEDEESS